MNNSISANNVLNHHHNTSEMITAFLKPLADKFGISSIGYLGFKDNQIHIHDTNQPWIELSLERELYNLHYYYEEIAQVSNKKMHAIFRNDDNNIITKFANRHGFGSELSIYKTSKKFIEMWHFRTEEKNSQNINFYLNNLGLLNQFIAHIKKELPFLFNFSNDNYISSEINFTKLVESKSFAKTNMSLESYMKNAEQQNYRLFYNENINSNAGEMECLYFLNLGQSVDEIALTLNISPKVVKKHLLNFKNKFGLRNFRLDC